MGPIAVEMPPTPVGARERVTQEEALLRACSEASAPDRCLRAADVAGTPEIIAVVSWNGELSVRIEVAARKEGRWLERTLTFTAEDPPIERWQATGLAIGTLVGAQRSDRATTADGNASTATAAGGAPGVTGRPAETPSEPLRPDQPTDRSEQRALEAKESSRGNRRVRASPRTIPTRFSADVGFLGGSAWGEALRYGPTLVLGTRLASGPFIDLGFGYFLSDNRFTTPALTLHTDWWSVEAGAGMSWLVGQGTLAEMGLFPGIEFVQISTPNALAHPARVLGRVEGQFRVRQQLAGRLWLRLTAEVGMRLGETDLTVDSATVGTIPLLYGGLSLAVSVDLFVAQPQPPP